MADNYTRIHGVMTCDIIGSRALKEGLEAVESRLEQLNERYRQELTVSFTLYRGDEIQGVVANCREIPVLVRLLRSYLYPCRLRIGVGIGSIDLHSGARYSWQMNGNAFHFAREALEGVKRRKHAVTCFAGLPQELVQQLNVIYALVDTLQERWTEKQWRATEVYERCGTLEHAARELQITPQNVSKRCLTAGWRTIVNTERYLSELLGDYS